MRKIVLTKVQELSDALHPNNIPEGYTKTGYIQNEPKVGESFFVHPTENLAANESFFNTSKVVELLPDNKFKTLSSIYLIGYLD